MTGFDFSGTLVRSDDKRWLSGLSIPESITRNSIIGKLKPLPEISLLSRYVDKLSPYQKKIILASSIRPKSWSGILRHAKVTPRCVKIGRCFYNRPSFRSGDFELLYHGGEDGACSLTSAGKIVQDYIKAGSKRG